MQDNTETVLHKTYSQGVKIKLSKALTMVI